MGFGQWLEENAMYGMTPKTLKKTPGVSILMIDHLYNQR